MPAMQMRNDRIARHRLILSTAISRLMAETVWCRVDKSSCPIVVPFISVCPSLYFYDFYETYA